MSLVLSASVKADIRLEQAVKQFEVILTAHQSAQFRAHRNAASTSPPTIIDVRNLLLNVDSMVRAKTSTRRAFSPRLSSVVEAVQKFASIGDILVGGSQNLIACGVWSIIRLVLLSLTTSLSTLERLSSFFMAIGRSAPRYEDLAVLYPQSERLQTYLCEYHIILVNLCRELILFTQKSTISLLVSSMSSSVWDSHQKSLEQWSTCIKEEVSSLVAQTIENDSSLNSTFRAFVTGEMKKDSLMKQLKARRKALDACTTYDYEMTWRQQRKIGTVELFKDNELYMHWKKSTRSGTLIVDGKLGSGKTVMMANIVDDLRRDAITNHANVAYFFCRHDVLNSLKARTILGSLVREILRTIINPFPWETATESLNASTSTKSIVDVLLQSLPIESKTYFVIDGIDDCDAKTIRSIQEELKTIQLSRKLSVCISLRTSSLPIFDRINLLDQSVMVIPEKNLEIDSYITMELERRIQSGSLALVDPNLVREIYLTLIVGAKGMFLWVALQIECLCLKKNDEEIRLALLMLPQDLPDLFSRLLADAAISHDAKHDQKRILELIISAVRPLHEEELREALSVNVGNTTWDISKLPSDIRSLLSCCGSLITVDEEDRSIRLVHHSVLQYLLEFYQCFDGTNLTLFTQYGAHKNFADILITYLSYGVFETQVSKTVYSKLPMRAMQNTIVRSTFNDSVKQKLAMQILKNISRPNGDAGHIIGRTATQILESNERTDSVFHLHDYARTNLSAHAWVYFNQIESHLVNLLQNIVIRDGELADLWRQNMKELDLLAWDSQGNQGLALIDLLSQDPPSASHGYTSIFSSKSINLEFLAWACGQGRSELVLRWLSKVSKLRIPYPNVSYAKALQTALAVRKYRIALVVAKHIGDLIPNLIFANAWIVENIGKAQIGCSIEILDQILHDDNADGLQFLIDCGVTNFWRRTDPIIWRDVKCSIGVYDRSICRNSMKCLLTLQRAKVLPFIARLHVFTDDQAKMRDELLYEAILLGLRKDAIALTGVSTVAQNISEDDQLRCLSLAIVHNMDDLIMYMLRDIGWFKNGHKKSLKVPRGLQIKESIADLLRERNLHLRSLDISSPVWVSSSRSPSSSDITLKPELAELPRASRRS